MTVSDEMDDEGERLIALIKSTAAEYISGYTQLHSASFKKEVAQNKAESSGYFTSFFSSCPSME